MAFRTQKISQMTPKGSDLEATDLIEVSTIESGSYVTRSITGQELIDAIPAPSVDWGDIGGTLSDQTDLNTALSGKVPTSRTLTINGTTQDLSADRTFTISTGITIGTTLITSGTVGRVLFQGTGNVVSQSANLFWDATNNRLGIGTSAPISKMQVITDNATSPFAFSSQTSQIAGTTTAGVFSAYSLTNGGYLNCGNPDVGWVNMTYLAGRHIFSLAGTEAMRITNGNVLINTTTDAGFRLDVNGTARVQGVLTIGGEIFGATNTYFNGPSLNTGTLWLRFNAVNSNGNFTATGPVQGTNVIASGTNSQLSSTGSGVQGVLISNTATSTNWRIEGHRTTSGALEFKNDLTNPVLNLFSTRNVGIGTFTDAGFRLDVNGTARVKGTGTTSATTALRVENSGGTRLMDVRDDGSILFRETPSSILADGTMRNTYSQTIFGALVGAQAYPVASAIFEVQSTTKGLLFPRMTTTQKNAIASPAAGLQVFDTTLNMMSYYNGTIWISL
ncbi:hypothetical protein UFOVP391_19 [uncultured Caudovirales phage]|uniref:Uncharacterized protein n=1 Tax=uncultured Caudovirales phage TaxID=2100421 RepID=A0A6J7X0Q5_9CAUD|nr:hypothetical protein UFOVP391_19 [uncultured Caudovirales phage]